MASADIEARKQALFARATDQVLATSLRTLDAIVNPSGEERMVRAWTIEELERRHPAASAAVEKAFEETDAAFVAGNDADVDYVAVLLAAIPGIH